MSKICFILFLPGRRLPAAASSKHGSIRSNAAALPARAHSGPEPAPAVETAGPYLLPGRRFVPSAEALRVAVAVEKA